MKAVILAGGFGTRLQSAVPDLPKAMAPIDGQPFLAYLLRYLKKQGISRVLLSVHYLKEKIMDYFQDDFEGLSIDYVIEKEPLGTGGAILYSLACISTTEPVFVLNGDTFVKLNYREMYHQHQNQETRLTFALREVPDCSRYGKVLTDKEHVTGFREKGEEGRGFINAGVYLMNSDLFHAYPVHSAFSFEQDFIHPYLSSLRPHYFLAKDYFIDIGIPEDYHRAQRDLPLMLV